MEAETPMNQPPPAGAQSILDPAGSLSAYMPRREGAVEGGGGGGGAPFPPTPMPGGGAPFQPTPMPTNSGSFEAMFGGGGSQPGQTPPPAAGHPVESRGGGGNPFESADGSFGQRMGMGGPGGGAPSQGRRQSYSIRDVLPFIPPALVAQGGVPMDRSLQIEMPADGSHDVKLSAIYTACPDLFAAEITPLNDSRITLPDPDSSSATGAAAGQSWQVGGLPQPRDRESVPAGFSMATAAPSSRGAAEENPFASPAMAAQGAERSAVEMGDNPFANQFAAPMPVRAGGFDAGNPFLSHPEEPAGAGSVPVEVMPVGDSQAAVFGDRPGGDSGNPGAGPVQNAAPEMSPFGFPPPREEGQSQFFGAFGTPPSPSPHSNAFGGGGGGFEGGSAFGGGAAPRPAPEGREEFAAPPHPPEYERPAHSEPSTEGRSFEAQWPSQPPVAQTAEGNPFATPGSPAAPSPAPANPWGQASPAGAETPRGGGADFGGQTHPFAGGFEQPAPPSPPAPSSPFSAPENSFGGWGAPASPSPPGPPTHEAPHQAETPFGTGFSTPFSEQARQDWGAQPEPMSPGGGAAPFFAPQNAPAPETAPTRQPEPVPWGNPEPARPAFQAPIYGGGAESPNRSDPFAPLPSRPAEAPTAFQGPPAAPESPAPGGGGELFGRPTQSAEAGGVFHGRSAGDDEESEYAAFLPPSVEASDDGFQAEFMKPFSPELAPTPATAMPQSGPPAAFDALNPARGFEAPAPARDWSPPPAGQGGAPAFPDQPPQPRPQHPSQQARQQASPPASSAVAEKRTFFDELQSVSQPMPGQRPAPEPPPAKPTLEFADRVDRDVELRAVFGTDEPFDAPTVARLTAELPGVAACVFNGGNGVASRWPDNEANAQLAREIGSLLRTARELANLTGAGGAETFTMHTDRGIISLFTHGEACLAVRHKPGEFDPGVREKLMLVSRGAAALSR